MYLNLCNIGKKLGVNELVIETLSGRVSLEMLSDFKLQKKMKKKRHGMKAV